ncbi:hypothetical protein ACOSZF_20400 [Cytobacillus firmus]|uniref:hypothetical protein n=1 Tax=Cytobacillus firmus TaxID=1399 RepID=UPI003BA29F13
MPFMRVKELEEQVTQLQKDLKAAKVDSLMMEKYLREKGLLDDYEEMAMREIRDVYAGMLRRDFKIVKD